MALNLGHNLNHFAAAGAQVALQVVDHISCLHKRNGDEVYIHLDGEVDVQPVLQHFKHCFSCKCDSLYRMQAAGC